MGKNAEESKMIKKKIIATTISLILLFGINNFSSAKTWDFKNIGKVELTETINFEEGEQETLLFKKYGGMKKFFIHSGATQGQYYTMTYSKAPHFSYGWATSQVLGIPYLLENNLFSYKNAPIEERMDIIAKDLNSKIIKNNALYKNKTPLIKQKKGKKSYWSGVFSISQYEKGILYNEEYQVVIHNDGYEVKLGIICYDGNVREINKTISGIIKNVKFYK